MNSKENRGFTETHEKDLGLSVPNNYFSTSKKEILTKIAVEKKTKVVSFYQNKFVWFVAAGITLLVALTVFKPNLFSNTDKKPLIVSDTLKNIDNIDLVYDMFLADKQDITVASLFMDDTEISNYITNNIIEDILIDEEIDYFILEDMLNDEVDIN